MGTPLFLSLIAGKVGIAIEGDGTCPESPTLSSIRLELMTEGRPKGTVERKRECQPFKVYGYVEEVCT